ncbi:hypothetical protein AD935_05950 [Gluconobacter japonicus]|nr:hypothetical protein AD935_05950 [Gluconobacter japonicus]
MRLLRRCPQERKASHSASSSASPGTTAPAVCPANATNPPTIARRRDIPSEGFTVPSPYAGHPQR